MLFLRGGVSALSFGLLQGGDCLDVAPEFLLCTACAEIIVQNAEILRRRQRCERFVYLGLQSCIIGVGYKFAHFRKCRSAFLFQKQRFFLAHSRRFRLGGFRRGWVMLRLVKTQSANLHIIGEVVFVTGIYRHGFLGVGVVWFFFGDSRILCGGLFRLRIPLHEPREALPALRTGDGIEKRRVAEGNIKDADALDDIGLAVFQIHRIAHRVWEFVLLRDGSRFGSFHNCFLRRVPAVLLHVLIRNMNEVAEIEVFQLIGNKLLQRAVLPGFQMLIIQIALQPEVHKVDIHLKGNLIVGDSGVGDADLRRVAEIRLRAVFAPAEVGDQPLCTLRERLLCLSLQLQTVRLCLPFACKFLGHAVRVHIVAVCFVVPHGVHGTKAPVKAYHMEAVCGIEGRFFLLCLSFLRRDPLHIRHNLPDKGAVAISLRIHNLPIYNTAFSKRFPDGDGVNIIKVILFLLGVEVVGLNELRNAPLHLCPRQYNRLGISHGDLQRFRGILQAVLPCQPCGGIPVAGVSLHIADNCVLALNPAVPLLQGRVNVRLRHLVGRGRDHRCQRGIQLVQKLLMQPVMERGHIEIEPCELQILRRHNDAPDCRRPLQIGVLTVGIAAGVEESIVRDKRVAHAQAVSLEQLLHRGLRRIGSGVAEHPCAVRAELGFVCVNGGFCFMVNGAQGIDAALTSKVRRFGNRHIILIAQFLYIHL